jgi:hypothetical protein
MVDERRVKVTAHLNQEQWVALRSIEARLNRDLMPWEILRFFPQETIDKKSQAAGEAKI